MRRSALISGGAGGLGGAVVSTFVADGWRVVAPVRHGRDPRLPTGAYAIETDLTEPDAGPDGARRSE